MKFTLAWAEVTTQNQVLKYVLFVLGLATVFSLLFSIVLIFKPPIVVERGCVTEAFKVSSNQRSKGEIENFVREALLQRFDSSARVEDGYLAPPELDLRQKEQKELQGRGLDQRIIVRQVEVIDSGVTVDCDRLVSINNIRSAFPLKLKVRVESKTRTLGNPYGLILSEVKVQQDKELK